MGHDQACAWLHTAMDLPQRSQPFAAIQEVQREQAGGAVERPRGCLVDESQHEVNPLRERRRGLARQIQHRG